MVSLDSETSVTRETGTQPHGNKSCSFTHAPRRESNATLIDLICGTIASLTRLSDPPPTEAVWWGNPAVLVEDIPEFRDVQIAYCDRQPLSPEQAEAMTYEIVSKVSVDSCGGDLEAYQKFLASEQSKPYVQV